MAISSYMTYLMHGTTTTGTTTWSKLVDIKDFPALGGEPERIDVTTLSDPQYMYIPGIQTMEAMTFTANYDAETLSSLKELEGKVEDYAVWFGGEKNTSTGAVEPKGNRGKFTFKGELSVYADGAGSNEAVNMKITIMPTTVLAFDKGTT